MKQSVGILIFDDAEVLDFAGPYEVFSVASQLHNEDLFDVKIIAKTKDPVLAVNGLSVNPDYAFDDAPHLDIVIVAGGSGTRAIIQDQETLQWVGSAIDASTLALSICSGSLVFGKLGYLDGKPYATHHEVYDRMIALVPSGIPQYEQRYVQSDTSVYTSGGISAGIDLSFHIVETLHGQSVAKKTAKYMEYKGYQ